MKQRTIWFVVFLLVAGGTLTAIRWKAWFGMPPEPVWVGDTLAFSPSPLASPSFRGEPEGGLSFLVLGDIHSSWDSTTYRTVGDRHPDAAFYVQLGDWVERPYFYYIQHLTHSLRGSAFDSLPVLFLPGNHEYSKGICRTLAPGWDEAHRVVDFPHLRIVAINTMALHTLTDYTRLNAWAKRVVWHDSVPRMHIVLMHHPVYSTAEGRFNPLLWLTFARSLNRADVVFCGHDHHYVRQSVWHLAPIWKDLHPTTHITTNASFKRYPTKGLSRYQYQLEGTPVYHVVTCMPDELSIQTLRVSDGAVVDSVVIARNGE